MYRTFSTPKRPFFILLAVCICVFIVLNLQIAYPLIHAADNIDKLITVTLNFDGSRSTDNFWYSVSSKLAWIPLGVTLLLSLAYYKRNLPIIIFTIVGIALTVTLADQISSSFIKPYFERLRPSHNEEICNFLHYVNGYHGGQYGFVSSHAANAFGVLAFLTPMIRHKAAIFALALWACSVCYSRIYLGVHYFGDIVGGSLLGLTVGYGVSWALQSLYLHLFQAKHKTLLQPSYSMHGSEAGYMIMAICGTVSYFILKSFGHFAWLSCFASSYVTTLF